MIYNELSFLISCPKCLEVIENSRYCFYKWKGRCSLDVTNRNYAQIFFEQRGYCPNNTQRE